MDQDPYSWGDKIREYGALAVTVIVLGILIWWLVIVGTKLGPAPTVIGKTVTLDEYQRSKDILLVVLPLATTAVGFWLGNQNTQKLKDQAAKTEAVTQEHLAAAVATAHEERNRAHLAIATAAEAKAHQTELHLRDATAQTLLAQQQLDLITASLADNPHPAFTAGNNVGKDTENSNATIRTIAAQRSQQRGAAHPV